MAGTGEAEAALLDDVPTEAEGADDDNDDDVDEEAEDVPAAAELLSWDEPSKNFSILNRTRDEHDFDDFFMIVA